MISFSQYQTLKHSKLLLATHNSGKIREIRLLLKPFSAIKVVESASLGLLEPAETGRTFIENALLKARTALLLSGLPSLADDSGLCIDALDGEPGVYTADWFTTPDQRRDFNYGFNKIKQALLNHSSFKASMVSVLVLAIPGHDEIVIEKKLFGRLTLEPQGVKGFGLDPIFIPEGYNLPLAMLDDDDRLSLSARGQAMQALTQYLDEVTFISRN
jgi:XTP/dITP diphosphohydrolase